jgi:hypothetical protein
LPYPRANPRQVFGGNAAPGAFGLGHDAFGDLVVGVLGMPCFFTAALPEQALGGAGALGLQLLAQPELAAAVPVDPAPGQ